MEVALGLEQIPDPFGTHEDAIKLSNELIYATLIIIIISN